MSRFTPQILQELNMVSVAVRLLLAMILSGCIGFERGMRRRPAGFRTYMLVCVGAALVMMTNQFILQMFKTTSDPARLGAQVINGIGFLGAGTIIVTRNQQVKGLTTAAGLWASACMGLAVGIGFYEGAILSSILIYIIMTVMHALDNKAMSYKRKMDVYIELEGDCNLSQFIKSIKDKEFVVLHAEMTQPRNPEHDTFATLISLRLPKQRAHYEIADELKELDGVCYLEEI